MLAGLVAVAVAVANPGRPLARAEEEVRSSRYAAIEGERAPVARWRRIGAPYEAWVFPDGHVEHFVRYERRDPKEAAWFNAGGDRVATATWAEGARTFQVLVPPLPALDVTSWMPVAFGGLSLQVPASPPPTLTVDGLAAGRISAATFPMGPVVDDAFRADFTAACGCTLVDRNTAWVAGLTGVRYRFTRPNLTTSESGEVWAVPVGDHVFAAWTTYPDGDTTALAELRAALLLATLAEPARTP